MDYKDVRSSDALLEEMLRHSGGQRRVPVIVAAGGKVTIGFGGT